MTIRPYKDSDLVAVAELFTGSVHGLAAGFYEASQLSAWAPISPNLDLWRERLSSLSTVVAEHGGQLAGFVSYENNGHIEYLYVAPAFSGQGVASALHRHVESVLAGLCVPELFTEASLVAYRFFIRQGFNISEEQSVEFGGAQFQRYAMRKALSPNQAFKPTGHKKPWPAA